MKKIEPERTHKFFGVAVLEPNVVVRAHIVNENIQPAVFLKRLLDGPAATFDRHDVRGNHAASCACDDQVLLEALPRLGVLVHEYGNRAFASAASRDGLSDSFCTTSNQDNFIFELQIHQEPPSNLVNVKRCPFAAELRIRPTQWPSR